MVGLQVRGPSLSLRHATPGRGPGVQPVPGQKGLKMSDITRHRTHTAALARTCMWGGCRVTTQVTAGVCVTQRRRLCLWTCRALPPMGEGVQGQESWLRGDPRSGGDNERGGECDVCGWLLLYL